MNNTFSFKRFARYAKAEMCSNYRQYVMFVCVAALFVMVACILNYTTGPATQWVEQADGTWIDVKKWSVEVTMVFSLLFVAFMSVLNVSMNFKKYFSKSRAVEAMMMPVSMGEKFTYHGLTHVVLYPFVITGLTLLIGWIWALCLDADFLVWDFGDFRTYFDIGLFILAALSVFFFGSILFRRYHLFLTAMALGVIIVTVFIIGFWGDKYDLFDWLGTIMHHLYKDLGRTAFENLMRSLAEGFGAVLTVSFVWLSWRRFKHLQISK